ILAPVMKVEKPAGAFYLGQDGGGGDEGVTLGLFARKNLTGVPGRYLARAHGGVSAGGAGERGGAEGVAGRGLWGGGGGNPGGGGVRISLVAPVAQCVEAAERIRDFLRGQ